VYPVTRTAGFHIIQYLSERSNSKERELDKIYVSRNTLLLITFQHNCRAQLV